MTAVEFAFKIKPQDGTILGMRFYSRLSIPGGGANKVLFDWEKYWFSGFAGNFTDLIDTSETERTIILPPAWASGFITASSWCFDGVNVWEPNGGGTMTKY